MRKKVSSPTDNAVAAEPMDDVRAEETTARADTAPTAETPCRRQARERPGEDTLGADRRAVRDIRFLSYDRIYCGMAHPKSDSGADQPHRVAVRHVVAGRGIRRGYSLCDRRRRVIHDDDTERSQEEERSCHAINATGKVLTNCLRGYSTGAYGRSLPGFSLY